MEDIFDKLDIIPRTVEMTKLYGCDYESVVEYCLNLVYLFLVY